MATYVVRTLKSGLRKVKVMVRRNNAPSITQTFPTRREAEAWAMSIEGEILGRDHSPRIEATRRTLEDVIRRYKEVELARKTRKHQDQLAQLNWWAKELGHVKLAQLTGPVICRQRDKLAAGMTVQGKPRQPATVNRYLAALSHALSLATRDWGWMEESPMNRVRKLREPRGRIRYLSHIERGQLLAECAKSADPHLYLIVLLALCTGMRRGEISSLEWSQVHWQHNRIVLLKTKNDDARGVPLPDAMLKLLQDRYLSSGKPSGLVFPSLKAGNVGAPWDFTRGWRRVVRDVGLLDFRFHDLRHSCASYLALSGATTTDIAAVLGHRTLSMVKRYTHLTDSHVARVINTMAKSTIFTEDSAQ